MEGLPPLWMPSICAVGAHLVPASHRLGWGPMSGWRTATPAPAQGLKLQGLEPPHSNP